MYPQALSFIQWSRSGLGFQLCTTHDPGSVDDSTKSSSSLIVCWPPKRVCLSEMLSAATGFNQAVNLHYWCSLCMSELKYSRLAVSFSCFHLAFPLQWTSVICRQERKWIDMHHKCCGAFKTAIIFTQLFVILVVFGSFLWNWKTEHMQVRDATTEWSHELEDWDRKRHRASVQRVWRPA